MAHRYTPTTWVNGTTPIDAANLNNLETAGQDSVDLTGDTMTGALSFTAGQGIILNETSINGETVNTIKITAAAGTAGTADMIVENGGGGRILIKHPIGESVQLQQETIANAYGEITTNTNIFILQNLVGGNYGVGFKRSDGTRLAEAKGNGDFAILGSYLTGSGNMDSFHIAESIVGDCPVDHVMCLGDDGIMHQCTHSACPFAVVSARKPGLGIGAEDDDQLAPDRVWMALAGRVQVYTSMPLKLREWVTSDGHGTVRKARVGELALGYVLDTASTLATILLKPYQLPRQKRIAHGSME
jgi:hypothetical protein